MHETNKSLGLSQKSNKQEIKEPGNLNPPSAESIKQQAIQKDGGMKTLISWNVPEYEYYEKGGLWYAMLGIVALAFLAIAFFLNNFLFGIIIIIAAFAAALYAARRPKIVTFSINTQGILIGRRLYPYEHIKSFWIFYNPPYHKKISIKFKKTLMPRIIIPFEDTDPNTIREALIQFIREMPHEESLSDIIIRLLKF